MNGEKVSENLYEIPSCTICLGQLCQDLCSLACGHVFHINCIRTQVKIREACPLCRERSNEKEIIKIHYLLTKNNYSGQQLRDLNSKVNHLERKVEGLQAQVKKGTKRNQRYRAQLEQYDNQTYNIIDQQSDAINQLNRKKVDLQTYHKELLQLKQSLHGQIKTLNDEHLTIRTELQTYRQKQRQFQNIKTLSRRMKDNEELNKYKNQLQAENKPAQQMAQKFFEMIQIKNMQVKRVKQKIESFPQLIADKDNQINQLRKLYLKQKKEKDSLLQKRNLQKKKYQELEGKYKQLVQKQKNAIQRRGQNDYNENENDIFLISNFMEDSQDFLSNNTSVPRNNLPIVKQKQTQLNFKAQNSFYQVPSNQTFNNQNKQMVNQANKNGYKQTKLSHSGFSGTAGKFKKKSDD